MHLLLLLSGSGWVEKCRLVSREHFSQSLSIFTIALLEGASTSEQQVANSFPEVFQREYQNGIYHCALCRLLLHDSMLLFQYSRLLLHYSRRLIHP